VLFFRAEEELDFAASPVPKEVAANTNFPGLHEKPKRARA
jgi:hypothetical protein